MCILVLLSLLPTTPSYECLRASGEAAWRLQVARMQGPSCLLCSFRPRECCGQAP